jgi:hypothetical protein
MMRRACLVALALLVPVAGAAQGTDTARTVSPNHGGMALGLIIANAVIFFAPPAFLLFGTDSVPRDTAPPAFRASSITLYGALGFTDRLESNKSHVSWTTAVSVQVYHRRLLAEARIDEQGVDRAYRLRSAEIGYLFLANPRAAGGLSIGLQRVGRDQTRDALTVGLPLIGFGHRSIWGRLEPRYVVSSAGVEWHYRAEIMGPITRHSPFIIGGSFEFKPLPERGPYHGVLAVLLGVRP